jgi:hypothetical protein
LSKEQELPEDTRTPYERFRDVTKQIMQVPPEELKRRQEEWESLKKRRRKKNGPEETSPEGR